MKSNIRQGTFLIPTFTMFVLMGSYGVLVLNFAHIVFDNCSGIASLGNFGALLFSVPPYLTWKAIKLYKVRNEAKATYFTWSLCVAFPFIGFLGIIALISNG